MANTVAFSPETMVDEDLRPVGASTPDWCFEGESRPGMLDELGRHLGSVIGGRTQRALRLAKANRGYERLGERLGTETPYAETLDDAERVARRLEAVIRPELSDDEARRLRRVIGDAAFAVWEEGAKE